MPDKIHLHNFALIYPETKEKPDAEASGFHIHRNYFLGFLMFA